jgi:hypothetical protein
MPSSFGEVLKYKPRVKPGLKNAVKVATFHSMKITGEVVVQLHSFLTSALDGGNWSTSRLVYLPGKNAGTPVPEPV